MRLAVIPARGGSKRIPQKNIRVFCGKPIIAWSIEAAHDAGCFDAIIVSTDDSEIASVSRQYGADVPFSRPPTLSDDYMPTAPVIAHAVDWMNSKGRQVTYACCIYATAPFVTGNDLQVGLTVLQETGAEFAFAVTTFASPIQRAFRITDEQRVEMFDPTFYNSRSQDLEQSFHDAGQFYWGTASAWLTGKPLFSSIACPIPLPRYRVQDIDTLEDWKRAEAMFKCVHSAKVPE